MAHTPPRGITTIAIAAALVCAVSVAASASQLGLSSRGLVVGALPVTITTTSLTGVADTFADQASPNANAGTSTTMSVQSAAASNRRAFVRFSLTAIPATARVQSATLQLTMSTAPSANRSYEADRVLATWTETGLTWNTMPSAAAATASVASGTTSGVNLTWDVTGDAKTFVASSSTNFGWQIRDSTESSSTTRTATFRAREFSAANQRPTLTIIYAT
jgi:hypothetical protein